MGRDPLILAIETATGCGGVSLTRGEGDTGRLLAECTCQPEVSHSRRLLGSVDWVMRAAGVGWADLAGVAVSLGPGSFTGLRIGMAAAKGIAMAAGCPLIGVPTLDALAYSCFSANELLCCLLDARKQQVYAAFYRFNEQGEPEREGDYLAIEPRRLVERIAEPVILAGPGAALYRDVFAAVKDARLAPPSKLYPRAADVGYLGCRLLAQGAVMDPVTAAPMYVRASEAEINIRKKNDPAQPAQPA